jgi:hypothetical protein
MSENEINDVAGIDDNLSTSVINDSIGRNVLL